MAFDGPLNAHPRAGAAIARGAGAAGRRRPGARATAVRATLRHLSRLTRRRRRTGRRRAASGADQPGGARLRSRAHRRRALERRRRDGDAGVARSSARGSGGAGRGGAGAQRRRGRSRTLPPQPARAGSAHVSKPTASQCHGERGDGSGPAAGELPIAPADLTRQRPTLASTRLRRCASGIEGTSMAPWTSRLTDAELHRCRPLRPDASTRRRRRRPVPMITDAHRPGVGHPGGGVRRGVARLAPACGPGLSGPSTASRTRRRQYDRAQRRHHDAAEESSS